MGFTGPPDSARSMLGIVVSRADEASVHVGDRLRALVEWTASTDGSRPPADGGGTVWRTDGAELRTFDGLHIELEGVAEPFDAPTHLAFASRHSGDTGPLLTAHATGNFGPAPYGGEPDRLAMAAPGAMAAAVDALAAHAPAGYEVGFECTHHGPTDLDVPSLFVEVGSAEEQWRDPAAATAVAEAILALRGVEPLVERSFVGLGGGHYAPRFTRIVRETDWAVGHVAADWGLEAAGDARETLLRQAFDRSGARLGVVDGDRPELVERVEGLGYRVVGERWLRETDGVPLRTVEAFEARLTTVDNGLRFGRPARTADDGSTVEVREPAESLLAAVNAIDAGRVRDAVAAEAVAFETAEAGNRVAGRVAVADHDAWARLEASLVELLRERYVTVDVSAEAIEVTERVFDPERARALGVEPGPAFGKLAGGAAVVVDGRPVAPEAVHVTRRHRFPR